MRETRSESTSDIAFGCIENMPSLIGMLILAIPCIVPLKIKKKIVRGLLDGLIFLNSKMILPVDNNWRSGHGNNRLTDLRIT